MPFLLYSPSGDPSLGSNQGRIEEDLGSVPLGGGEGVSEGIARMPSGMGYRIQGDDSETSGRKRSSDTTAEGECWTYPR